MEICAWAVWGRTYNSQRFLFPCYQHNLEKSEFVTNGNSKPVKFMLYDLYCTNVTLCGAFKWIYVKEVPFLILCRMFVETNQTKKKIVHTVFYKFLKQYSELSDPQNETKKAIDIKEFASSFQSKFDPAQQHDAH